MNILRLADNVCLIELPAQLTDSDETWILNAIIAEFPGRKGSLLLDFSAVHSMNGLGAYFLVKLGVLARKRGQSLLAFGVNSHYRDVLKVTGLEQVIAIYNNRDEAFTATGVSSASQSLKEGLQNTPLDLDCWAKPVSELSVSEMPLAANNRNLQGRRVVGPVDGFGQLWQKTYRLTIDKKDLTPESVVKTLKQNLPALQPSYNRFYPSKAGILTGEVVAIDSSTPGGPVSTGVLVMYADDLSFTFMTPQGHPESGWVTFNAFKTEGKIVAQITGLARANDPIYEAAFRTVGSKMQVHIWKHVLTSLAEYSGVPPDVTVEARCIDRNLQWSQVGNVWYNAQIRTIFYLSFKWMGKMLNRGKRNGKK